MIILSSGAPVQQKHLHTIWGLNAKLGQKVKRGITYRLFLVKKCPWCHSLWGRADANLPLDCGDSFLLQGDQEMKEKPLSIIIFQIDNAQYYRHRLFLHLTHYYYIYCIFVFLYNAEVTNLYFVCSYTLLHWGIHSLPWPELFWAGETLSKKKPK